MEVEHIKIMEKVTIQRIKMIKRILIVGLLFISFSSYNQKDELLQWSDTVQLKWKDFTLRSSNCRSKHSATTVSDLVLNKEVYEDRIIIKFEPYFNRKKSCAKIADTTVYILKHEQVHFDVDELYSRLFYEELAKSKIFKIKDDLKISNYIIRTANRMRAELNNYQLLYDKETTDPINSQKQEEWNDKIDKQLKELEEYNITELVILRKKRKWWQFW
jgi:hypothetical protein